MQIQAIQQVSGLNNKSYGIKRKPIHKNNGISFKSYEKMLAENAIKKFEGSWDASSAFRTMLKELLDSANVEKTKWFKLLNVDIVYDFEGALEKLSRPIAEVPSEWRDLVLQDEKIIPLIKKDGDDALSFVNWGKRGFWNALFDSQSAGSDVRFRFNNPKGVEELEFGLTKDGGLYLQGSNNFMWTQTKFTKFMGFLISHKTGSYKPLVW